MMRAKIFIVICCIFFVSAFIYFQSSKNIYKKIASEDSVYEELTRAFEETHQYFRNLGDKEALLLNKYELFKEKLPLLTELSQNQQEHIIDMYMYLALYFKKFQEGLDDLQNLEKVWNVSVSDYLLRQKIKFYLLLHQFKEIKELNLVVHEAYSTALLEVFDFLKRGDLSSMQDFVEGLRQMDQVSYDYFQRAVIVEKARKYIVSDDLNSLEELKQENNGDDLFMEEITALETQKQFLGEKIVFPASYDSNNHVLKISENNKITLLFVWGTFCPYCKMDLKKLVKLYEMKEEYNLEIIGLAFSTSAEQLRFYPLNINFPQILLDDEKNAECAQYAGQLLEALMLRGVPQILVLNPQGQLVLISDFNLFDEVLISNLLELKGK
ncbi:MAG TPA: TlpA disulfide reductase family protein [Bdellovibrionota bacterium]|nr:TlpA disulfide reductase family protein [Bdellovibrionota bacterium]